MYNCPHCRQSFNTFAFYCPCCQRPVGEMQVEGVMLAAWWLDAAGQPASKWGVKTLKSGQDDLDLVAVSPQRPSTKPGETSITFRAMTTQPGGGETSVQVAAAAVFAELLRSDVQEWEIQ